MSFFSIFLVFYLLQPISVIERQNEGIKCREYDVINLTNYKLLIS